MKKKKTKERIYTGTLLAKALTTSFYHSNGYNHVFTYDDIMTLMLAWADHPKFPSISESAVYKLEKSDGEVWLKESEVPSFASYIGYKLLMFLK